jgi:putative heme transporter
VPSGTLDEREQAHPHRYRVAKIVATVLIVAILAIELVYVLPYISSTSRSLRHLHIGWLVIAVVAEGASMAMFARLQRRMVNAGGVRVPLRRMIGVTYAANAMSVTVPAGTVASTAYMFRKLRSWGAGGSLVTFALVSSGVLSTITLAVILVLGATFSGEGSASPWILGLEFVAAIVGAIALRRLMHRPDILLRVGNRALTFGDRVLRRPPDAGRAQLKQIIDELILIRPRNRDWLLGLLYAFLNWAYDLICLVAACKAVGASGPSISVALVAYAAGMTASSIPLLPGGLGVVDGVLILALVRGGMPVSLATAGVLIYRIISLGLVSLVGWLLWVFVERTGKTKRIKIPETTVAPAATTAVVASGLDVALGADVLEAEA